MDRPAQVQTLKRLLPVADTRNEAAGAMGCFITLPLAVLILAGCIYLAFLLGLAKNGESMALFIMLAIALSLLTARIIGNWLADRWQDLALRSMQAPDLSVSSEKVRPGDSFTVVYHQDISKPLIIDRLSLKLVRVTTHKREVLGIPDDFNTEEKIHQAIRRKGRVFRPGEVFHREVLFTIPGDAPPTTKTDTVEERWLVHAHLYVKGRFDYERDFLLEVE